MILVNSSDSLCARSPLHEYNRVSDGVSHILSMGSDLHLLQTRELVLKRSGSNVSSLFDSEALDPSVFASVSLLILCHTLGDKRLSIVKLARVLTPELPILLLHNVHCAVQIDGVRSIAPLPHILLSAVRQMIGAPSRARQ